jgi:tetratricopeptide (TPR) repeat protein
MSREDGGQNDVIQARTAPLSHLATTQNSKSWALDRRNGAVLGGLACIAALVLIVTFVWEPSVAPRPLPSVTTESVSEEPQQETQAQEEALAPFAQLNAQRARQLALRELGLFVEQQILLEDTMQVGNWGSVALEQAKALAVDGDAEFVAERFANSIEKYTAAAAQLEQLIATGDEIYAAHVANGLHAMTQLDPDTSVAELTSALTIKPESDEAKLALARAERLPEVIGLLRTAKNHELGERYNEAVAVYDDVRKLDPLTPDLAKLRSAALAGAEGNNINSFLSEGFAALERKEFEPARTAFNKALQLDPGNDVAQGGIQQVQQRNDLAIIADHREKAEAAVAAEHWNEAIDKYQQILNLDTNIQFALNGRRLARAHERADRLLTRIKGEPRKLSSEKLYLDAKSIVSDARELTMKGPKLDALVGDVESLILLYRDPVDVVLVSDSETDIVMSNVGKLGAFDRKTLSLRPGQYTIRGSQDGCRDIYLSIDVLPGIAPIDLSCKDELGQ